MMLNLRAMVSQVRKDATALDLASGQLASTAQQNAQVSGQIASSIQEITRGISLQTESVTRTDSNMEQVRHAIDKVAGGAQAQGSAMHRASGSNEVTRAMENIANVSKENNAATLEVSAATDVMSIQMEETTDSVHALAEMARELQTLVSQFKLEEAK
jgi:methyl-accepting chemotaxis protein